MAEIVRLAKIEDSPPDPADFLLTETAKECLRALHAIHTASESRFTMIAGAAGVGKTKALQHFVGVESSAFPFTVFKTEGTSAAISEVLMRAWRFQKPNGMSITARRDCLLRALGGRKMTLIFDEAQNFEADGMEWLTMVAEEAGWSVAFVGGADLPFLVEKCPSLSGRIPFPVIIRAAAREDALAVSQNLGVTDRDALNILGQVSQGKGGLRKVSLAIEAAQLIARGGEVTAEHVRRVVGTAALDGGKQ